MNVHGTNMTMKMQIKQLQRIDMMNIESNIFITWPETVNVTWRDMTSQTNEA